MGTETKSDRLLSTKDVTERLKSSSVTLWRLVKAGEIPKPIKLTERGNNLYKESWIQDFIDRIEAKSGDVTQDKIIETKVVKTRSSRRLNKKTDTELKGAGGGK